MIAGTTTLMTVRLGGHHEGLDRVHPVHRLVEYHRSGRLEDLVGDLQRNV
jgi:hypothetical protein